ncbi:MAG: Fic family protein [Oscillospiraceae bacterium]|nr:Fic family protein [Oscillospiraceae bacterium]
MSDRYYNNFRVRAVWNDEKNKWYFSVLDIVAAIRGVDDYEKNRNYWKYLKNKLKKEGSQVVSGTTQLKITAPDGKKRLSDVLTAEGIVILASEFPARVGSQFIEWFTNSDESLDGKSKKKAYSLFGSPLLNEIEIGTVKGLQQIHSFLFGGLYDFAGQIRKVNISKNGFQFANALYLDETLKTIEKMPEDSFERIIDKYIEMNVAHPFREGNGRSTRIWLDTILRKNLSKCIDWSKINKKEYLDAMKQSVVDGTYIKKLLFAALTDRIDDREVFMKGIDYSYYYETDD